MTPNQRGIALMLAGMAGFAVEDAFIKFMAAELPAGQINLGLGCAGALIFGTAARRKGLRFLSPGLWHPAVIGRNLCEMLGSLGYVVALAYAPLVTVSAVFQATPLAVTMGAALFLGERVGWRRWAAVLAGFVGVLIVIRPWTAEFDPASLLALVAVVGLGGRDLFTRRIPKGIDSLLLVTWGFAAVGLVGGLQLAVTGGAVDPSGAGLLAYAGALLFGCGAYWAITEATRAAEASVITPFRYSRLLFAVLIGTLVFAERPDGWTIVGGLVVVGSGLYAILRERARAAREGLSARPAAR